MKKECTMSYYLKGNWKSVSLACLFVVLAQISYAGIQLLMMQSVDAAFQMDLHGFLTWSAVSLAAWGACIAIEGFALVLRARAKRKLNNAVRHDLYLTLLQKNHAEYHSQDTGEYISWLSTNIKQIDQLAWEPFFDSVGYVALITSCVVAMLSLHWVMLVVGLLAAAVMLLLPNLVGKKMEQLGKDCAEAEEQGISRLKDLLSGFDVLRSFGRTDRILTQGDEVSDAIEAPNCRRTSTQETIGCVTAMASVSLQVLQQVVAVVLAFQGKVLMGSFVTVSNLTAGIANSLSQLANKRMSIASAKPYFAHITTHEDGLSATQNAPSAAANHPLNQLEKSIDLEAISFSYGEKQVLEGKSFRFEKGGKYALTGPSGCGKSTILKLLLGWLPDYSGDIRFDGADIRQLTPEQLQQQMSYIEQNVFLFNTTIRENITLGQKFSDGELQKALQDSALIGDLAAMPDGLDTEVGEEGSRLSGGQKQRVAIARALIHQRSILLVDEGTSALDQKNADIVEKSLLDNPNLTLILVSHHLSDERKRQFDRVYAL